MDIVAINNTDVGGISLAEGVMRPPAVNNAFRELSAELAQWLAEMSYPTVGGTADALTLTPTTALSAVANNVVYTGTVGASANATTTPTLAVSATAATVIRKMSGGTDVALASGDLKALTPYAFVYKSAANTGGGAWIALDFSFSTSGTSFADSTFFVTDDGDSTKKIAFQASGITTGTTRTVTMPDIDVTLQPVMTSAQYLANTAGKSVSTDQAWGAVSSPTALTPGTTVAWDLSLGIDFTLAPVQNFTLSNPTNVKVGQKGRIRIVQDGTGSRTFTKSSNMKTAGGVAIVLTTTAAAVDVIYYDVTGASEIMLSVSKGWA